ncbi:MlaC/ttg2D family ABC transporter substrate-binding protein [Roseobacter sinensis]|uniref:ABC transporter substrate-binding protein n=1 Tax=Roseobacter sinensis TaxID=2931391 RepID=A0ABT3BDI3_9RHOB|nr:ABC transporter substrate-binding protein [Roseobacter sp. WL0113]MCV3271617.1 ABC transporter substrate-binding protein [Roseobacter sp. WL0113]
MPSNLTRRDVFLSASALTLIAATPAAALTEAAARALVDEVVADIDRVINSGQSDAAILREFENLFARYADVNIMAQYALGADGRSASASQKRAFNDAFTTYITRKYGRQFRDFVGGRVEIQSARQINAGYEIRTLAYLRGEGPFEVNFHISDKSGSNKFFNVYIEGVNLLLTERGEIGAMLDRRGGDINAMIGDLRNAS